MMTALTLVPLLLFQVADQVGAQEEQKAVRAALSWYYRWVETIPRHLDAIGCSLTSFGEQSFAYCDTVALSMNLEADGHGSARVTYMGYEPLPFEAALANYRRTLSAKSKSLGSTRKFSFESRNLGGCRIDWEQTAHAASVVLSKEVRTALLEGGHTLRYPLVCQGDPFYLLYCLSGERLSWIWQYEIRGDQLEMRWSFDPGTEQRRPPRQAVENLKRSGLWYKLEHWNERGHSKVKGE